MQNSPLYLLSLAAVFLASLVYGEETAKQEMAKTFTLQDQYERDHSFEFPRLKPLVISVADPGGAKDAPVWTDKIKAKYGDRIEFWSIANLSFIPAVGQGAARMGIKATSKEPVLCDWDGAVSLALKAKKGQANIIVVTHTGEIIHRVSGTATDAKLKKAFEEISTALDGLDSDETENN